MQAAIAIGRYLIPHAQIAFGLMRLDPVLQAAKRILAEVINRKWSRFTVRDLFTALPRIQFPRVSVLTDPLVLLEEHGYVRREEPPEHSGPGRKPSPGFVVRPDVHTLTSAEFAQTGGTADSAKIAEDSVPRAHDLDLTDAFREMIEL